MRLFVILKKMIEKLKEFIKEAGIYAESRRLNTGHSLSFKSADSAAQGIVTEVDTEISRRFKRFTAQNFAHLNYMIVDEESLADIEGRVFALCAETDFQFVIDPIDGTMNYAAGIPLYGISIGVLKKGKPWLGLIYAPASDELVYTDGQKVWFENDGVAQEIFPEQKSSSRVVLGHAWKIRLKPRHFDGQLVMHDYFAAVIYCLYLILGRVRGVFMQANLWDIAGGWAVMERLGMGLYDYDGGSEMTLFNEEFFDEKCHVKTLKIGCFKNDFQMLRNLTSGLNDDNVS